MGMTVERAKIRARALWGKAGYAQKRKPYNFDNGKPCPTHSVGVLSRFGDLAQFHMVKGSGFSFEEAFENYEKDRRRTRASDRAMRLVELLTKSRAFLQETTAFWGEATDPVGEQIRNDSTNLENEITTLLDEIEGGS